MIIVDFFKCLKRDKRAGQATAIKILHNLHKLNRVKKIENLTDFHEN